MVIHHDVRPLVSELTRPFVVPERINMPMSAHTQGAQLHATELSLTCWLRARAMLHGNTGRSTLSRSRSFHWNEPVSVSVAGHAAREHHAARQHPAPQPAKKLQGAAGGTGIRHRRQC